MDPVSARLGDWSVEDYWPQRLIHIPSMTSVQRHTAEGYLDPTGQVHQRPKYNILTYTWGRYEIKGGNTPCLKTNGTEWTIPSIDPEHFSTQTFSKVVAEHLGNDDTQWAWIDIACINQLDGSIEKDEEIGHQLAIFSKGFRVYAWLSRLDFATIRDAVADMNKYSVELRHFVEQYNDTTPHTQYDHAAPKLASAFAAFFGDPWFSSLWTLQEITMRRDAIILCREGDIVEWDKGVAMSFTMIANLCQNVWNDSALVRQRFLTNYRANGWNVESTVDVVNKATERLRDILTRTGFYFLFGTNPNVQYGTAKYRTTKREMDRVYAIMQLYDIKVGAAARPGAVVSSFRELQIEFAVAINKKCPIMGQSFTHTTAHLVPESTWCITQESTVPDILRVQYDSHPMCQISISEAGNGVATFRGKSCLYADLAERIKMTVPRAHGGINTFQHAVDAYVAAKLPELNSLLYPAFNSKDWHISDDIRVLFGKENLKVLYLGTAATSLRVATNRVAFGLIVSRKNPAITVDSTNRSNGTAARTYYRYGVVTWRELVIPDGVQVGNIEWTPEEIQLR